MQRPLSKGRGLGLDCVRAEECAKQWKLWAAVLIERPAKVHGSFSVHSYAV